jgi:hypothetical protein
MFSRSRARISRRTSWRLNNLKRLERSAKFFSRVLFLASAAIAGKASVRVHGVERQNPVPIQMFHSQVEAR